MKAAKILLITLLIGVFAFSAASCKLVRAIESIGIVKGSGNVISEDRDISGFSKISISGSGNLFIEQGEEESLTIEAEDNIIPLIITKVSGDTLSISFRMGANISAMEEVNYYLNLKDLSVVETSGSVNISCSGLDTDSLTIDKSGSGEVEITGLSTNDLKVDSSGSGSFIFTGTAKNQEIDISGSGNYDGRDLISENCIIDSSGNTGIIVNVTGSLDIETSGSGDVRYTGNPSINYDVSGSGEVINISD